MYNGIPEEGDKCGRDECQGVYVSPPTKNCSCHINPPCSACTDKLLVCDQCGKNEEEE
jgi:hypothetical protein